MYIYIHMYKCIYIRIYLCIYIYHMYICIHICVCIYTYTSKYNPWLCNLSELHVFGGIQYSFLLGGSKHFQTEHDRQ